ncbi:MAG: TRAP transporter small permease subunit [Xanthomonadaceae bacterium]|nr:TRAP transporter small permease subunit [Xanthomonadaceae bacterium]MDP2185745.1 TRAP transporter small permease subunit [Xanthomonadales bacterium]MDZ4115029.1 TRAP transporter small permease subunit [Xanthomonadaceae bacterium]MDZ4376847.1 TRAP transporter small permease subunit [Xanthomonadaceae bacterium]
MTQSLSPALRIARALDLVTARFGQACAWLTVFLVLGTALVVLLRYGFGIGAIALQEAVLYSHALVFMGAAGWVLQRNAHVRVDIFYHHFSSRRQALVDLLGTVLFLFPFCLFLGWASWDYVGNAWHTHEGSNESGGLPFVYLQKSIILILVASLLLQGLSEAIKAVCVLRGNGHQPTLTHG